MQVADLPDVVFPELTTSQSVLLKAEDGYLILVQHEDGGEVMILGSASESAPDRLLELGIDQAGLEWLPNEGNIVQKALAFFTEKQGALKLHSGSAGHASCGYLRLTEEEQEKAQAELDRLTVCHKSVSAPVP